MPPRPADAFPFSAIVGQETLKTALLLNAVDPRIAGVLIRGEKGTAKSTAVRALASVLPEMDVVEACRFGCDPSDPGSWCHDCRDRRDEGALPKVTRRPRIVDLPVSATEDRLIGSLDIERALREGVRAFEPGLLAEANRGVLYVDEVNLLDDHLVDTLLDAAAMGVNVVEREGVQFSHPARFILVGTMNPEEGDVRPQLLDRFGLCVDVEGIREPERRVEIVRRRQRFEDDAPGFMREWRDAEAALETTLRHARVLLSAVSVGDDVLLFIARVCSSIGVDGHRADITMSRAAAALAALEGRREVGLDDVRRVAPLVLAHRGRRTPLSDDVIDERALERALTEAALSAEAGPEGIPEGGGEPSDGAEAAEAVLVAAAAAASEQSITNEARLVAALDRERRSGTGRRQTTVTEDERGRYTRSEPARPGRSSDIAVDATIRAAAPKQASRQGGLAVNVQPDDLRTKVRERRVGACALFCVDASGSMSASNRIDTAKAAVLDLLSDAYKRRDRVGLVTFRGDSAELVLPLTSSVEIARLRLRAVETGGATPLAIGMVRSLEVLEAERRRNPDVVPWLVLVTDGRANVGIDGGLGSEDARAAAAKVRGSGVHTLVLDTNPAGVSGAAARELARSAGAEYVRLDTLDAASLARVVRDKALGR